MYERKFREEVGLVKGQLFLLMFFGAKLISLTGLRFYDFSYEIRIDFLGNIGFLRVFRRPVFIGN